MKYIKTAIAEQETIINILYEEQIISVYSCRSEVITLLTKALGKPSIKHEKNKTYLTGATWNIPFADSKKLNSVLMLDVFVDKKIEVKPLKVDKRLKKEKAKKSDKNSVRIKETKKNLSKVKKVETETKPKAKSVKKSDKKSVRIKETKKKLSKVKKVETETKPKAKSVKKTEVAKPKVKKVEAKISKIKKIKL